MKGILIDTNTGDALIEKGGIVVGDNTEQIAECVLKANRGEFKEYPLIGAEVIKMANGIRDPMWCANARKMLQACGVPVEKITLKDNIIRLE